MGVSELVLCLERPLWLLPGECVGVVARSTCGCMETVDKAIARAGRKMVRVLSDQSQGQGMETKKSGPRCTNIHSVLVNSLTPPVWIAPGSF